MESEMTLSRTWITSIYCLCAFLASAAVIRGLLIENDQWVLAGFVTLVIVMVMLPIGLNSSNQSGDSSRVSTEADRIKAQIKQLQSSIDHLNENIILSDDARRVINRRTEKELLCKAIQEDIELEDWNAGMVLVRELAERFGYREEAEVFRTKIDAARSQTVHRDVHELIEGLNQLIQTQQWDKAMHEAARISRVYHDNPLSEGLRHRVEQAKDRYIVDIERQFLLAAQEDRIDQAMALLKEMDHYLSEQEAEQFREVARGVIGKARDNLGVQFKLAVNDRSWKQADHVGTQIIQEFPNTRMAQEVREMIDEIRKKI